MAIINHNGFRASDVPEPLLSDSQRYYVLPEPIREFLMQFQTACVVECCGIDAFDFSSPNKDDVRWRSSGKLESLLELEIENAEEFPAPVVRVWELNQLLLREDFVLLLRFLRDGLQRIREQRA